MLYYKSNHLLKKPTSFAGAMGTAGRTCVVFVRVTTVVTDVTLGVTAVTLLTGINVGSFFVVTKKS